MKLNLYIDYRGKLVDRIAFGWSMSETIGVSIINPRAIAKLTKVIK